LATVPPWDAATGVDPAYRAFVPVFVAPPAPQIDSVSAGGQVITGSTSADNSSTANELTFDVSNVVSGATVSVYVDGVVAPIATGTVAAGATSITLTTDGSTTITSGTRTFTVKQTIVTSALTVYAGWSSGSGGLAPAATFPIPASSLDSPASTGTVLTIG
jgi:hypothetical protein